MGVGAIVEPLVVFVLLFGGTWINRVIEYLPSRRNSISSVSEDFLESGSSSPTSKDALLGFRSRSPLSGDAGEGWRQRRIAMLGMTCEVTTPNTAIFRDRLLSRVLWRFPFLVECWYWALVYWTYQIGRAFTALTLQKSTVVVARGHTFQLIKIEESLGMFWEVRIQTHFLRHAHLMVGLNWIYSFIHIPGTIAFLVWLYYYTTTGTCVDDSQPGKPSGIISGPPAGPLLYQERRRTLAVCNLLAFVMFTLWPCMPPRLLSDPAVEGAEGELARSYGFVDTVHGANGMGSVWTANRFCNQYAAMPSLHFGYSLVIGFSIMTIPLSPPHQRSIVRTRLARIIGLPIPSWRRLLCLVLCLLYPFIILVAIVATANHFILDAVVGALVCALAWWCNGILLSLLPLEDYFLCLVRIHKPEPLFCKVIAEDDDTDRDVDEATPAYAAVPS
ncbi:hypothetical protein N7510_002385 [Penicillium lagena]|uniref:uncharacterized protein n=1 Tax=Penicillium lagena TaxID=94218 RepID=UPI00253FCE19|nr:uncharacterized protein N7510_002385 [Penicillium lagena]KAJ5626076.1 hypothetical protein N7510_002385 [Penicillium lagena]